MTNAELRPPSGLRRYLPRGLAFVLLTVVFSLGLLGLIIPGGNGVDHPSQDAIDRAVHRVEACLTHERPHACINHPFRVDRASHTARTD